MISREASAESVNFRLRRAVSFCLDVVFPPVCARCRRVGSILCAECASQMARVPDLICPRCGRFHDDGAGITRSLPCGDCRRTHSPLIQMRAPLRYAEPTSRIIHRFKYEGYFALGEPLARFMFDDWPVWEQPPDLILPIPLHPKRRRRRGYNQSELLAAPLGRSLGVQTAPAGLRRVRHTAPQVGLGPNERHDNVRDAFAADASRVSGRHVLLVDDVLTTGATMRAAAEALLAAGAASISAYCLARVS